ncbi:MAG: hypothetical protein HY089_05095, partial [Ignavibacteriales bacterium]|nr:hypothetical protein [Ignavibacteriales bacterium]
MMKKIFPLFFFLFPALLLGQVYLTKEQALKLYFPNATVERKTVFLTDKQVETIQTQAKSKVES